MAAPYNIDKDLSEAQKMAEGLSEYVRGTELYGHTGGGFFASGDSPALTIGALLLRLRRLQARSSQLNAAQQSKLKAITETYQQVRDEWRVHYETKLVKEATSRLNNILTYVREATDAPRSARGNYPTEAMRRTIVQEVLHEMEALGITSADVDAKRREADTRLRGLLHTSSFQWDSALQDVYPAQDYWWLYQIPEDVSKDK